MNNTSMNAAEPSLDAELMAFSGRRRIAREARESELAAAESRTPEVLVVESLYDEFTAAPSGTTPMRERKLERVIVDDVDLDGPNRIGELLPSRLGASDPSDEDSYAVKRVLELRRISAGTPTQEPTEQTKLEAAEAHRINMDALEEKKPGKAFGAGGKKAGSPAKSAVGLAQATAKLKQ